MQGPGRDAVFLVNEVELGLVRHVAQKVLRPVQVCYGLLVPRHKADEPLGVRDVDEAIAHPRSAHHLVGDLAKELEGCLDAILVHGGSAHVCCGHRVPVVPEHVEGVGSGEDEVGAVLGPDHELGHHIDAADEPVLRPVIEADEVATSNTDESAAVKLVHHKGWLEGEALLEILEDGDLAGARIVPGGISAGVAPHELQGLAEGLVAQRLRGVDHELAIATDCKEPSIGMVRDVLGEDLRCAHLLDRQRDALTVPGRHALINKLEVRRLDLVSLGKDDLAAVHGGHRLLTAQLDDDSAFIVADGCGVGAVERGDGPDALEEVVEGGLEAVGGAVPDAHGAILAAGEDDGQRGVEKRGRDIIRVAGERLDAMLGLVVPDLHSAVIRPGYQVGLLAPRGVLDAVYAALVTGEGEVGCRIAASDAPDLDGAIQGARREDGVVLGVPLGHHDVVRVALKDLAHLPVLLPVPELNRHVVR
mmetsp:Transcript_29145/g.66075  ORF Transcript_29145/g.66075 Transcript_29145/m.66075 type:complete len:475 (-) Transcript_29145:497-1921(-)